MFRCPWLSAHIDLFPTLVELAGARVPEGVALDGRSLAPLLGDAAAPWSDRLLFTHVGRWAAGRAAESKYVRASVRSARYNMVSPGPQRGWELYDMGADPGETTNVAAQHSDQVRRMEQAYDRWWDEVLPCLENENATPPPVAPYKKLYWKQYGGGPGHAV